MGEFCFQQCHTMSAPPKGHHRLGLQLYTFRNVIVSVPSRVMVSGTDSLTKYSTLIHKPEAILLMYSEKHCYVGQELLLSAVKPLLGNQISKRRLLGKQPQRKRALVN